MHDTARGLLALAGVLFLFLIPLGTRKVVGQLGSAGDFTRLAIFALDLFAAVIVVWWLRVRQRLAPVRLPFASAIVFLAVALLAAFASPVRSVALTHWVRLGLAVVLALAFVQLGASSRRWLVVVAGVLVAAGVIQAAIAVGQVVVQRDLGLRMIGESRLAPDISGVAKIDTPAGKFIRGSGTFPHPNILAAFLAAALMAWWWLFVRGSPSRALWRDAGLFVVGALLLAGFAATFSRLGVLAVAAGFACATWRVWYVPGLRRRFGINARLAVVFVVASAVGLSLLFPLWFSRFTVSRSDQTISLRLDYLRAAGRMVADRPLLGVGPGTFAEALPRYSGEFVEPWQRQPVHNVPVLVLAELGILGGAALAVFLWRLLRPLFVRAETTDQALVKTLAVGWLVVLGVSALGDHFLWAVPQGKMLLWAVLGIVAAGVPLVREGTAG